MKQITVIVLALIIALLTSACATKYQPMGRTGGFTETRLAENIYRINFSGNGFVGSSTVTDYATLRAAELTLESGYLFFTVPEAEDTVSMDVVGSNDNVSTYHKPRSDLTIVMHKTKPDHDGIVYDAEYVKQSIRTKHGLTE
jgi:hypothetical protein